jgi:cobalt-zinc-cadmium efflux system outer membrane protein
VAALVQSPAIAEDEVSKQASPAPPALRLDDAIREAIGANRDLRTAYFVIDQARARLLQAGLWPNPSLEFSGSRDFAFANEGEYATSTGFEQRFPVAGRIVRAKDLARVDVALALAEVRNASRRLIGEVKSTFYELVALNAQIAVRNLLIGVDRRLVEVSEARSKRAEVSAIDVNTARIELERLELEQKLLGAQAQARSAELNKLLGREPATPLMVEEPDAPAPPPSVESLFAEALRRRPDLQQAFLEADRARAERGLAKAERWEDWAIGFDYERDRAVIDGAPAQRADQLFGLRLTVPLPVWNANQGRIAEAGARESQAKSKASALELTIRSELEAASRRAGELASIVERYRTSLVPLTDRNVVLSQDAYRAGLANISQVVQVQRQQSDLQTAYVDAVAQYRRALLDLEIAAATSPFLENPEGSQ